MAPDTSVSVMQAKVVSILLTPQRAPSKVETLIESCDSTSFINYKNHPSGLLKSVANKNEVK